ncbi:hypothetical protein MBLNU459_g8013t1 [Dothideomycetes sp. NU459]
MDKGDVKLYTQFTNLKQTNPSLQVFISVGGWSAGGAVFSNMTYTSANRAAFIASLKTFMKTYAFDGVDLDWEYPVTSDRGGNSADFANYVTFLKELRSALGTGYGISATLPSSYWYMQNFDIAKMEPYLDWFNIMTYDIHGTWDGNNPYTSAVVQAHTNLTEIDAAMDLLWRNNIDSSKVVLGLGFYGRAFTLKDTSCTEPGCPFSGGGDPGNCTATSGILSDSEIEGIISAYDLTPTLDKTAAVKYMTWNSNQWVSYDDSETFKLKIDYANKLCLGGTMVWALDLDSIGTDTSINSLSTLGSTNTTIEMKKAVVSSNSLSLGLFWTVCLPMDTSQPCPNGYTPIAWGHGKVFDADLQYNTGEGCHGGGINGFQRALCAASNVHFSSLQWGPGTKSKACNSKCPTGWVTVTKNSHITGQGTGCKSGKYAPLCAYHMMVVQNSDTCYASSSSQLLSGGLSSRTDVNEVSDYNFADNSDGTVDLKVRSFRGEKERKRLAKKKRTVNGSYGCGETLPVGDIAVDIPAALSIQIYGSYTFYNLVATSIKTTTSSSIKPTKTVHVTTTTTTYPVGYRTCDGDSYPQACFHYSSVAQSSTYSRATCSNNEKSNSYRPLPIRWLNGHKNTIWREYIAESYINPNGKRKALLCEKDEWPPNHFQQGRADGWIRLIPNDQNSGAANRKPESNGWKGFCKFPPPKQVKQEGGPIVDMGSYYEMTSYTSTIITLSVMSYTWTNVNPAAGDVYGLTANKCRPSVLTADVGYALQTNDWWYTHRSITILDYNSDPGQKTKGVSQPNYKKRGLEEEEGIEFLGGKLTVDEGNSTRLATDEEIEELGYVRCETPDCEAELDLQRSQQAAANQATLTPESKISALANPTSDVRITPTLTHESRPTLSSLSSPTRVAQMSHIGHLQKHNRDRIHGHN